MTSAELFSWTKSEVRAIHDDLVGMLSTILDKDLDEVNEAFLSPESWYIYVDSGKVYQNITLYTFAYIVFCSAGVTEQLANNLLMISNRASSMQSFNYSAFTDLNELELNLKSSLIATLSNLPELVASSKVYINNRVSDAYWGCYINFALIAALTLLFILTARHTESSALDQAEMLLHLPGKRCAELQRTASDFISTVQVISDSP